MAYNVMIVDDLVTDRAALEDLISKYPGRTDLMACSFSNGADALARMREALPDIVICDLDMPVMDGFALTKEIKRVHPTVKVIFCSHYQNFEYARKALYLDNYGYVTKPVNPIELYRALDETIAYIAEEKQRFDTESALLDAFEKGRPLLQDHFIKELLFGQLSEQGELSQFFAFWGLPFFPGPYRLIVAEVDDFQILCASLSVTARQVIAAKIRRSLHEAISCATRLVCQIDESHFAILFPGTGPDSPETVGGLISSAFLKSDISLTAAASDLCQDSDDIPKLTEQCYYTFRFKYTLGKGRTILYSDIKMDAVLPQTNLNKVQQDVTFIIHSGNDVALTEYFSALFSSGPYSGDPIACKKLCFDLAVCLQNVLLEKNLSFENVMDRGEFVWGTLSKLETARDAAEYLIAIARQCMDSVRTLIAQRETLLAKQVQKAVYSCDLRSISIGTLADQLHYSTDHLNYLFRKATGETISEFITKYRVAKAKELLEDPALKLYQIAEQLGYSHTSYFTSVFKKHTGLTPREYREASLQERAGGQEEYCNETAAR